MTVYKEPTDWVSRTYDFFCTHCGALNRNRIYDDFELVNTFKKVRMTHHVYKTICQECHNPVYIMDPQIIPKQEYVVDGRKEERQVAHMS